MDLFSKVALHGTYGHSAVGMGKKARKKTYKGFKKAKQICTKLW